MNEQRRRALAAKTLAEKARLSIGMTAEEAGAPMQPQVIFHKHFLIEPQPVEDGSADEYAVYRVTDMLSTVTPEGTVSEPLPVHVFELLVDAVRFAVAGDEMVDVMDSESVAVSEKWRVTVPTVVTVAKPDTDGAIDVRKFGIGPEGQFEV